MNFRNAVTIMILLFSLAMAGKNNRSADTSTIEGRVNSVNPHDSMIVIESDKGMDTVYFDSRTEFTINKNEILRPDTRIMIKYIERNTKKIATAIKPASSDDMGSAENGDGGGYQDTTENNIPDDTGNDTMSQDTSTQDSVPDTTDGEMQ
jgi:hypothetical protein